MEPIRVLNSKAAPLKRSNVDTDQIIPAVYMRRLARTGFDDVLFENWRTNDPEFILNNPIYQDSTILVAGPEFGTGSSREHAVWALKDYGFRVILSSRFADIFRNNCAKNGVLAAIVEQENIEEIWQYLDKNPGASIEVNLEDEIVLVGDSEYRLFVDQYTRHRLLNGLDDIDITLSHLGEIELYETKRPNFAPKTLPIKTAGAQEIISATYEK